MSYILKALRKSEAERSTKLSGAVLNQWTAPPAPDASKRWYKVVAVFLLLNVLTLAFFFLKQKPTIIEKNTLEIPLAVKPAFEQTPDTSVVSTDPVVATNVSSPAISELWQEHEQGYSDEHPKNVGAKIRPLPKKIAVARSEVKQPQSNDKLRQIDSVAVEDSVMDQFPALKNDADKATVADSEGTKPTVKTSAPLLRELSADFQAKVPPFKVNVFAYSELPGDRFVIIDMIKYKIGQRVKQQIQLVDILPDCLILRFDGQEFRADRV